MLPNIPMRRGFYSDKQRRNTKFNKWMAEKNQDEVCGTSKFANKSFAENKNPMINVIKKKQDISVLRSPLTGYSEGELKRKVIKQEYKEYVRKNLMRNSRSSSPTIERMYKNI